MTGTAFAIERSVDLDALRGLWVAMVEHHRAVARGTVPVRASAEAWEMRRREYDGWLGDGSGRILVARAGGSGEPVGYAFLRTVPSSPTFDLGPMRGEVESLVVAPGARRAGIGAALLERARSELRELGCTYWTVTVMEANEQAVRLYEAAGFRPWLRELAGRLDESGTVGASVPEHEHMQLHDMQARARAVREQYAAVEVERYGRAWTTEEIMLGFLGDVGDLAKLVQGKAGVRPREDLDKALAHELADCLWSVLTLADAYDVDLGAAFDRTMDTLTEHLQQAGGPR